MDALRAYHQRCVEEAKERLRTMTPQELFNAKCDAFIAMKERVRPTDPEEDIDRPGEEEWK